MTMGPIKFVKLHADAVAPVRAHADDAGADLHVRLPEETRAVGIMIQPFECATLPTGLAIAIPRGYVGRVRPRSRTFKHLGLLIAGEVDPGYTGEVGILVRNVARDPIVIAHGARIAQLIVTAVHRGRYVEADALPATERGADGFGSTGTAPLAEPAPTEVQRLPLYLREPLGVHDALRVLAEHLRGGIGPESAAELIAVALGDAGVFTLAWCCQRAPIVRGSDAQAVYSARCPKCGREEFATTAAGLAVVWNQGASLPAVPRG